MSYPQGPLQGHVQVENLWPAQPHQPTGYTGSNPLVGMVNQAASNPIQQFQQSAAQVPYTDWSSYRNHLSDAILRVLDPNFGRGASQPIPDNPPWVQNHLSQ